jgi:hypothetical protein
MYACESVRLPVFVPLTSGTVQMLSITLLAPVMALAIPIPA